MTIAVLPLFAVLLAGLSSSGFDLMRKVLGQEARFSGGLTGVSI